MYGLHIGFNRTYIVYTETPFTQNKRTAKQLGVYVRQDGASDGDRVSASRSCALVRYDAEKIAQDALALLQKFNTAAITDSPSWYLVFVFTNVFVYLC